MIPHLVWLKSVDFVPLTYAGDTYALSSRLQTLQLVLGYVGHNLALLALPIALAALALVLVPPWWTPLLQWPSPLLTRTWSRGPNSGVNLSQALNVWIIQIIVAIGPPLGALVFEIYIKTDWGISLFFLVPLALVAIPALRLPRMALFNITAIWLVVDARDAGRIALDRRARDGRKSGQRRDLWRAIGARPRADGSLARALQFALARGRRAPWKRSSRWCSTVPIIRPRSRRAKSGPPA